MKKKKTPYRKEEPNLELIFQMPKVFISGTLGCFAKTLACLFSWVFTTCAGFGADVKREYAV